MEMLNSCFVRIAVININIVFNVECCFNVMSNNVVKVGSMGSEKKT